MTIPENSLRLGEIWDFLTGCCSVSLYVKTENGAYYEGEYSVYDGCPYYRKYARVKSIYAVCRERYNITIWENKLKCQKNYI